MGQLRYLADRTRPDILYPVNYLSRYMHAPSSALTKEVYRLIRYLKHTINPELVLGGKELFLYAMTDASCIHTDEGRSQLGYAIYLSIRSGCISAFSKRADSVALSSTQSEVDAVVETLKELIWFQGFLESININLDKPTLVLVDNQPAVKLANDGNNL